MGRIVHAAPRGVKRHFISHLNSFSLRLPIYEAETDVVSFAPVHCFFLLLMDKKSLITITFDSAWISEKIKEGVRIVRLLEGVVHEDDRARVSKSSREYLTIETDMAHRTDLLNLLSKTLSDQAGEQDPWAHAEFSGDLVGLDVPREGDKARMQAESDKDEEEADTDGASADRAPSSGDSRRKADTSPASDADSAPAAAENRKTVAETLQQLCEDVPLRYEPSLVGYLHEVAAVVPRLQTLGAMDHFWRRHLLVSIDDGWGFTAFRNSLCALYRSLGIAPADERRECREFTISRCIGEDPEEDWRKAVDMVHSLSESAKKGSAPPLICFDVSAWQEKFSEPMVKESLRRINDSASGVVCVYRVTFMEPGVLRHVERELNDILDIRVISAPSASMEDMVAYVRQRLAKSDFILQENANRLVEGWILGEMSDGSFFGYKTLDKIASRIVYDRVLAAPPDAAPAVLRNLDEATLRALPGAPAEEEDPEVAISKLVGMVDVKKALEEIVAQLSTQRELSRKGRRVRSPSIHMVFTGAPGTGKTTMARIAAGLLKKAGLLRKGHLVEVRGRDLCGEYVGQTAPKTTAICRRAAGSVLFIDEAYSLWRGAGSSSVDYGREALDTLVAEMENHRDDFCVILAGYPDEMTTMLEGNSGLAGRIPHRILFPNYTREELGDIFLRMLDEGGFTREPGLDKAVREFFDQIPDATMKMRDFGNARLVRNLYERVWGKAAYRRGLSGDTELRLLVADLDAAAADPEFKSLFDSARGPRQLGFAPV